MPPSPVKSKQNDLTRRRIELQSTDCIPATTTNNNKNFIQYSDGRLQEVCIKGNCRKRAQATAMTCQELQTNW